MKRFLRVFCCGAGGSLIGYYAKLLDTGIGCILFTLGIILVAGSLISIGKEAKREKENKQNPIM